MKKNAGAILQAVCKAVAVVGKKYPLKELQIQTRIGRQAEIKTKCVVERILPG
jgi:hypothetical protein